MNEWFRKGAACIASAVGSSWTFAAAGLLVLGWAIAGAAFGYSDRWELFINTTTSIVTFLMVFLVQSSQNRDAKAVHLKLDELLRAIEGARTGLANAADLSDAELETLGGELKALEPAVGLAAAENTAR